jgi:hypothetical protein
MDRKVQIKHCIDHAFADGTGKELLPENEQFGGRITQSVR